MADGGALLARARDKARLSRAALAVAAGVSRAAVARYEAGAQSPTVEMLDRLLAACGMQVRMLLEPLMADLDELVDALDGPLPSLEEHSWARLVASLNDEQGAPDGRLGAPAPRRGPVRWAFDGATALVLHGLAAEPKGLQAMDVVVVLDEAMRFWMWAIMLRGEHPLDGLVMDWLDADADRIRESLGGDAERYCVMGFVRIRVVLDEPGELPATVQMSLSWSPHPVPVVTVDEVERTNPVYAEVLARWRSRRELS